MDDRCEQHSSGHDEDQSGIEGVEPGEDFAAGTEIGLRRTHPTEQHRRVEKGFPQPNLSKCSYPKITAKQREPDDKGGDQQVQQ